MRRAFVETLIQLAERDPRVVFLTGDLGYQVFDEFARKFGPRYVNVGIAEALLVSAAGGLALEGYRPFIYSIASFMTGRPFEQIRYGIAYPHLPVVIMGAGGGYCYAESGVSHHAPDDLALMTLLPGMTVVVPAGPNELAALLPQIVAAGGPAYVRIGKFGEPNLEHATPVTLGRGRLLQAGQPVAILTTGETAHAAIQAGKELRQEGINPAIAHFHTVKPLDRDMLETLARDCGEFIVVEEASPQGGLYGGVLAWKNEADRDIKLCRLGPPDEFTLGSLGRATLLAKYNLNARAIQEACRRACRTK